MNNVTLIINGETHKAAVEPRMTLADFVREKLSLTGTHVACEHGVCGACTVMMDGSPVRACITYAVQAEGHDVRTIESFDHDPVVSELREAFTREHGVQCGFCTPGMLMTARDIVTRLGDPGEKRVRQELAGNLCRCTGYVGIVKAIRSVGEKSLAAPIAEKRPVTELRPARIAQKSEALPHRSPKPADANSGSPPRTAASGTGTNLSQAFVIQAGMQQAWMFFRDLDSVARCISGAELIRSDDRTFEGRILVKLGPIHASVAGNGEYAFDESTHSVTVRGRGQDRVSRSTVQGTLTVALEAITETSTRGHATLTFDLKGMLAQFSRSSIMRELTARIVNEFAERASASISGKQLPSAERNALGLASLIGLTFRALWSSIFKRSSR